MRFTVYDPLILLLILLGIVVLVAPWLIRVYNMLVRGRNRVQEGWANIEVQLNRRHELIPNIVNTVKGYAKHEDATFTQVTEARSRALGAKTPQDLASAERSLMRSLSGLYAVAENYPELKASGNFTQLQGQLVDTEDQIQEARTFYNGLVARFNTAVESFPTNLVANVLGFKKFDFYDAPEEAGQASSVQF
jgi:LemA protein